MQKHQSLNDLEAALEAGNPTLIYGLGRSGIPHVIVPIGRLEKAWLILDPGKAGERNPMNWSDQKLEQWWRAYWYFYPRGTMISLKNGAR